MTSSSPSSSAAPLAVQVMRVVLDARLPAAPDQRQAIEDALAVHARVCVRVALGHAECGARCSRSAPVEVWSVRVEEEEEESGGGGGAPAPLPGLFLLNAVRSYVHFSQLSAWLRPPEAGAAAQLQPPPAAASYTLAAAGGCALTAPADGAVVAHAFPLAADAAAARARGGGSSRRLLVRLSVAYVQRARPLAPAGLCLQLGPLPSDEWLLPSPLPSPSGAGEGPLAMATAAELLMMSGYESAARGKHKAPAAGDSPYSPNGPASKQLHFGAAEEDEKLVIEHARDEAAKLVTVVDEEATAIDGAMLLVEEAKTATQQQEQQQRSVRRRAEALQMRQLQQLQPPPAKREKKAPGLLRRMVGGWEECVLRGAMDGRELPQAGYTLRLVAPSTPSILLRLRTAAVLDTAASFVARATVTEADRVLEAEGKKKLIRRRGFAIPECGQLQLALLNGGGTALQQLAVPYDARSLPAAESTILRHRVRFVAKSAADHSQAPLRYLVQMSISRDRSSRCYLSGQITVLFSTDASVDGANVEVVSGVARAASLYELRAETITALPPPAQGSHLISS